MIVGLLKTTYQNTNTNESIIGDFAPSIEEADAILAKFGWSEQLDEALVAAWILLPFSTGCLVR